MKRSKHSLSYYRMQSFKAGELIPVGCVEVLPGDTFRHSMEALVRMQPMLAPVMHPLHLRIHHFFVPYRLLWSNWENFITGGPDGEDASVPPYITSPAVTGFPVGRLGDYLGFPTQVPGFQCSAFPFRAYALIFNEYYRDQDLVTASAISTADGSDTTTSLSTRNVAWGRDYFTTARPFPSKGADVLIPAGTVSAESDGTAIQVVTATDGLTRNLSANSSNNAIVGGAAVSGTQQLRFGASTGLSVDVSAAMGTLEELREAAAILRYQENRQRWGSRYTEYLAFLGVKSSDARLQRPEYLGGGRHTLQFSEVLATAEGEDLAVGDMKGHGIVGGRSRPYERFFEEHGLVMSLVSVLPVNAYMQGVHRSWSKNVKEDYWQLELQALGQQEIKKKEIYVQGTSADDEMWGYQDRYDEYRSMPNGIAGEFRDTLNYWHMAREFESLPTLNSDFVTSIPTNRIFPTAGMETQPDHFYMMAHHNLKARRLITGVAKPRLF